MSKHKVAFQSGETVISLFERERPEIKICEVPYRNKGILKNKLYNCNYEWSFLEYMLKSKLKVKCILLVKIVLELCNMQVTCIRCIIEKKLSY